MAVLDTSVAASTPSGAPAPGPLSIPGGTGTPDWGALALSPAPVKTEPHPATVLAKPVAAPVANNAVKTPTGSVMKVDSKGEPVASGTDASHAADSYNAAQTQKTNDAAAAALAAKTGASGNASTTPYVSSSDSIETKENNITNTLNGLQSDNPAAVQAHQDYIDQIKKETDALETRRQQEIDQINKDSEGQKQDLKRTQDNETGVETTILQRAGGYLGMGASQTGALISLNQEHVNEMNSLEAKRTAAIQTANTAIDDKQFALAEAKVKEAQDYAAAQQTAKQKYFEDLIQVHKQQQDNITFAQDQAQKSLTALASLSDADLAKIDPASLKKIDEAYGVPGFAKNYIDTQSAINTAKSQSDALVAQQKMLTLLQDIPKGQKVTFPDPANPGGPGIVYTGLGKTGDVSTFTETDDRGRITLFTYDKGSNTVTRSSLGAGGKTKTEAANPNQVDSTLIGPTNAFLSLATPLDPSNPASPKFVTANQYVNAYQNYVRLHPGKGALFDTQFPMDKWVMPSQLTLGQQLAAQKTKAEAAK